ncbi:ATP-dependent DNA helicase PIF1-like isoform X3 [Rhinatrema bivittatum]|uniref:ATP-dependent DNA helicase PIF1-like isoform X3 n=1 Tax=Rhinatrema bivittatum TaxID=194408 RepID=UPI00112B92AF|nr:ATP-dependent DNA helicase PIF1-like isoform X3 [Rhinatrema bivittatum]
MLRHHVATDLQCSITIEHLTASGQSPKRQLIRNAALTLGRNEFRELVLRVSDGKLPQSFVLRQIRVFTRFVRDGKSSIQLISENIQLLFANCPPEKLKMFMKTLLIKHKAAESVAEPITDRTRLLSCLPRSFETISPVQIRDVQQANEQQAKANSETPKKVKRCWNNSISGFSNYGQAKRKRSESSENCQTVDVKALKKPALTMPPRLKLSLEQSLILSAVMDRKNVFFTGSAGIGSGKAPLDQCIGLANRPGVRQHWLSCQHLIIDEISMVEGEFFDKLEAVARAVRRREDPFGGIHLIISGDFLQLPPVMKTSEKTKFCFQAKSWKKCIQLNMELTEVRRQTEKTFISLLQAIRLGMCPEEVAHQLMKTATNKIEQDGILATRLCTHKDDVELTNVRRLQQLPGEIHTFEALDSDPVLVKTIDAHSPVAQFIQLKKGAQVMLTKNLDVSRGLVNGARGVVVGFQPEGKGMPNVRFLCGVTEVIKPECWIFKGRNGVLLSRKQLPLKLAWAISIHKSQGMSLDCVEISLARVFESGQAYVALSRARSLQGLRVMDFDPKVVRADPHVLQFYSRLRKQCLLAQGEHVTKNQPSSVL